MAREYLEAELPRDVEAALFGFGAGDGTQEFPGDAEALQDAQERSGNEGRRRLSHHFRVERDGALPRAAKEDFRRRHNGRLAWEACGLEPMRQYGLELMEAHHRTPLSQFEGLRETRIEDFQMLCPTCHRAIHRLHDCGFGLLTARLAESKIEGERFSVDGE